MPAEGRGFRWKGWRKGVGSGSGRKAYHPDERAAMPDVITCISEGDDPSGRRRQGVIRSGDVPADQRKGASLVPRLARPARSSRPRTPCASRMIPPESPVPEIGTPGSESGGRNRAHGSRTAARCESAGSATEPYRLRASPRLYLVAPKLPPPKPILCPCLLANHPVTKYSCPWWIRLVGSACFQRNGFGCFA